MTSPATFARTSRRCITTLALGMALSATTGATVAHAATAVQTTYPAANATLDKTPSHILLQTAGAAGHGGQVKILDAAGKTVSSTRVHAPRGAARTLETKLPELARGVYTVIWSIGSAPARRGAFAFSVAGDASPALVEQAKPDDELNTLSRAVPRWLAFATIMVFIGALALRLLVTAPAVKRLAEDGRSAMLAASDRLLLALAGVAIVCFVPATLAQLVDEAADPDAGLGFWQSIEPGAIWDFLTGTPDGHLWLVRLGLTAVAAVVVVPTAIGALRRRGAEHDARRTGRVMGFGLALATAELVARVIPTKPPPAWPREIFTDALDFGHMFSVSIWIGGLAGLGVLGARLRVPAERRGRFWPVSLSRFSIVATVCVGTMILTGLWTAWIHVGPPRLLFHTLYGETLLVKLVLVLILVGLGAFNQLWVLPRVSAAREGGESGSAAAIVLRRFRRIAAAEVVVGVAILLVVPFLSGSARKQEFVAKAADLTQTTHAGGQAVRLRPSGAQPGLTDYDAWVPGASGRVTVAFSSPKLRVPETDVPATSLGGDRYRVTGMYTSIAGVWQARVAAAGRPPASFALDVTAAPADLGKPPPPPVVSSTLAWGTGEVLAVLIALLGARLLSRRKTRRRALERERALAAA
ncbi:MAG TPA: CopD family protein [Solirubrobacteraceae bacterium]|jgi:putative copper export protein/methionine-rich copper-binding protein CopC